MIVIVTNSSDLGADLVIRHLASEGERYIRVDFDTTGTAVRHFGIGDGGPELVYDQTVVRAHEVSAVWARRFARPSVLDRIEARFVEFTIRELACVADAFFESIPGIQVNSHEADRKAGNRLLQAELAKTVGFRVPESLVTQRIERATEFSLSEAPVITKALSFGELDAGNGIVAYTNLVPADADFVGVEVCPSLFQRAIPKRHEWRVTTVGNRLFSARTRADFAVDQVDWRKTDAVGALFEIAMLPEKVEEKLLKLCRLNGIYYGAHDLIETPEGDFYFLETNPAGQWGWLELSLGLEIGKALAKLLVDSVRAIA